MSERHACFPVALPNSAAPKARGRRRRVVRLISAAPIGRGAESRRSRYDCRKQMDGSRFVPIAAGMVYDFYKRGSVHPVYWIGAATMGAALLRIPFGETELWHSIGRPLLTPFI